MTISSPAFDNHHVRNFSGADEEDEEINVDVDDELEATKCWQRPCGCYTRAATAPQEPHTVHCRTHACVFLLAIR